jgi:hypothetical protein
MWTQFWDMHSGGDLKESPYSKIYIEAPMEEAKVIFYNRFGHNPERVTCTCCGDDYSISENKSLTQLTAYHRGCEYDEKTKEYLEKAEKKYGKKYLTLDKYKRQKDTLIISKKDIKESERIGEVPREGYVWM